MIDRIFSFFDWVVDYVYSFTEMLISSIWLFVKYAFQEVLEALNGFLHWIPVPDFASKAGGFLQGMPPEVSWFLNAVAFNEGLTMVMLAYVLRFILRRIPLIG